MLKFVGIGLQISSLNTVVVYIGSIFWKYHKNLTFMWETELDYSTNTIVSRIALQCNVVHNAYTNFL